MTQTPLTEIGPSMENTVSVHLTEYWKLKDEQIKRIEFRDHLVHIQLIVVGATIGWTFAHHGGVEHGRETQNMLTLFPLLILPWISLILGWTYLLTDERVSALGRYLRRELTDRVQRVTNSAEPVFGWEEAHRNDEDRRFRKVMQFLIDAVTFAGTGALGILLFWFYAPDVEKTSAPALALICVGVAFLVFLAWLTWKFTDFARGK